MTSGSIAIVAGASAEELDYVKQCLSDWQCVDAPLNDEETEVSSMPAAAEVIIIYARKSPKNTLAICEQLRNSPECSGAPILLVINRYEISQGSAVKRMGNATFIITPFNEKELRDKIMEIKKELRGDGTNGNRRLHRTSSIKNKCPDRRDRNEEKFYQSGLFRPVPPFPDVQENISSKR